MDWLREGHWMAAKRKRKEEEKAAKRQSEQHEEWMQQQREMMDDIEELNMISMRQHMQQQMDADLREFKQRLREPSPPNDVTPVPAGMTPIQHQPELAGKPAEVSMGDEWGEAYAGPEWNSIKELFRKLPEQAKTKARDIGSHPLAWTKHHEKVLRRIVSKHGGDDGDGNPLLNPLKKWKKRRPTDGFDPTQK
jgi:TolA-binding protein